MKQHKPIYTLFPWSVLMIALSGSLMLAGCSPKQQAGQPEMPPPEVSIMKVVPQNVLLTTELPGRTSPFLIAEIRPQVSGLILKRAFTEGEEVKAGQLLYQIDPAPYQAALNSALAALARSEANLSATRSKAERFAELLKVKAVSQQNYEDVAAGLKQLEADIQYYQATVESAKINLQYTQITSPVSGRIGKSNVTEGAIVGAYQAVPLATVQQMDPIYVDVPQSTAEILDLKKRLDNGQLTRDEAAQKKVNLILEDGSPYPLEGTLQFRDITVDPSTGSVNLRIVFPNPEGFLMPGLFVRAVVTEGNNAKAMLIPQQAVSRDVKGNPLTFIVNPQHKVEPRPLVIDRAVGNQWLVLSGLNPGDRVIVEGMQKARPGAIVKAVYFDQEDVLNIPAENPAQPAAKK